MTQVAETLLSDISGNVIPPGTGARVRITFNAPGTLERELNVTDAEALTIVRVTTDTNLDEPAYRFAEIRNTHPRAYEPWTAEEEDKLEAPWHAGLTVHEVAHQLGRQPGGIRSRLHRLGLEPRRATPESSSARGGKSAEQIW